MGIDCSNEYECYKTYITWSVKVYTSTGCPWDVDESDIPLAVYGGKISVRVSYQHFLTEYIIPKCVLPLSENLFHHI